MEWQPMATAKKGGEPIWAVIHPRLYPDIEPERKDLARWNGVQIPIRHPGLCEDGYDTRWSVAAPVGHGGFPDEWFVGWTSLPTPPEPTP